MNREIKFRVWDRKACKFIYEHEACSTRLAIAFNGRVYHGGYDNVLPEQGYIIQQWTGKVDQNSKNIYEGDQATLIEPYSSQCPFGTIYFDTYTATFRIKTTGGTSMPAKMARVEEGKTVKFIQPAKEVVGNIFEGDLPDPDVLGEYSP